MRRLIVVLNACQRHALFRRTQKVWPEVLGIACR